MCLALVVAWRDPRPLADWYVLGVVVVGVVVTAFPLVLGLGRHRAAYVLDGTVFVLAVLLLPPPQAFLAMTLPTAGYELAARRRGLRRRLYFASGTAVSNAVTVALFAAFDRFVGTDWLRVPLALVLAFASLGLYHAGMLVLLRLRGQRPPAHHGLLPFLFPAFGVYAVSALVGAAIAEVGTIGPLAFGLAVATASAFHLLYWQYRNMVAARTRTDLLFQLAAELPTLVTPAAIERRVRVLAAELLSVEDVELHQQAPPTSVVSAALTVRGRARWLVPTSTISNLRRELDADRRALQTVARVAENALERLEFESELRAESRRDPLTGVLNRTAFDDQLQAAIARARRDGRGFAIAYGDLDGFKPINDAHGHQVGDEVLRVVARRLSEETREGDAVARIGGDEFVLLLHAAERESDVLAAIDHAGAAVEQPIEVGALTLQVGISLGWARWPSDGDASHELIRAADARMYEVKRRR
ncbi:GGDEF domain-containing protein [Egicoccus halophilus]|uniref:GGDEF domain-containing protein n=1 Tax=Egicoccus halophilus TaxID=1670830 RepID=A0A8J3ADH5_9ACTN|nr:GGDEF domain-containing protein [Egicoccus halophilus]GGI09624.1 hypothetical protein GCM10011354_35000 [Egicoccus halophilus]